jgi:sortase A
MSDKREIDDLSVEELEQLLYTKRRIKRQNRLRRLKAEGRVVDIDGSPDDDAARSEISFETALMSEAPDIRSLVNGSLESESPAPGIESDEYGENVIIEFDGGSQPTEEVEERSSFLYWRPFANRFLLVVEVVAVVGLLILAYTIWQTTRELNQEIAVVQQAASESVALPTPKATPVIGVAVLPSGHKPPINGRPPEPGEAGDIPAHLLPILDAYVPPPAPTPGPEQARRLQIPAIDLDKPIVQGDSWEELKKGVGQHVGTSLPGQLGNIVLSAHNDIYGEIFRNLDQLGPGDEIIISTERQVYTYVVRDLEVVDPTDVWVMAPTEHASSTLISCYPYLVNNKRIVIFADLASPNPLS